MNPSNATARCLSLVLLCAGLTLPAGPAGADAAAEAVFTRARKASAAMRTVKASMKMTLAVGANSGGLSGDLEFVRPNYGRLRLTPTGAMKGGGEQEFILTGKHVYVVGKNDRSYIRAKAEPNGENLFKIMGPMLNPILAICAPNRIQAEGECHVLGFGAINGRKFQKVRVTSQDRPKDRVLFFGPTGLLEGIQATSQEDGQTTRISLWLSNLQPNARLDKKRYAYTPPADYTERDTTPDGELLPIGSKAPEFTLARHGGGKLSLSDVRRGKKAVLVTFWFAACGPCQQELPHLQRLYPTYRKRGLEIIAINNEDSPAVIKDFLKQTGLTFPVALSGQSGEKLLRAYKLTGFPTTYLLDPNGKIRWRRAGFDPEGLDEALAKALGPVR